MKRFRRFAARGFNQLIAPLERATLRRVASSVPPPVFIIGAPRSGTTLLYQLMVGHFGLGYIPNVAASLYRAPVLATTLFRRRINRDTSISELRSSYGRTRGVAGPSEAGAFWYRWFPAGDQAYAPAGSLSVPQQSEIRRTFAGLSGVFGGRSVVTKNTFNSLRILPLAETFPEAVFLVCHRDPLDNAVSILNGRIRSGQSDSEWWSVPPREVDEIRRRPLPVQAVDQVFYLERQIREDRREAGEHRFLDVRYESLCSSIGQSMKAAENFFISRDVAFGRPERDMPSLRASSPSCNDEGALDLMKQRVDELWGAV